MGESSACNTQGAKQMLQGQVKVDLFYLLIHIHNVDHFTLETLYNKEKPPPLAG